MMNPNEKFTFIVIVACTIVMMAGLVRTSKQLFVAVAVTDINMRDNDGGNKSYNLRGSGCGFRGRDCSHLLLLLGQSQGDFHDDNENKDFYVNDQYNFQYEVK